MQPFINAHTYKHISIIYYATGIFFQVLFLFVFSHIQMIHFSLPVYLNILQDFFYYLFFRAPDCLVLFWVLFVSIVFSIIVWAIHWGGFLLICKYVRLSILYLWRCVCICKVCRCFFVCVCLASKQNALHQQQQE